jgi:VCBS repeat-containing protein
MQKLSGLFLFAVLISGAFSSSSAFAQVGPIAEDDFYSVNEDSLLTVSPIGVLQNDTNSQNSNTFLAIVQTSTGFGTLTLNPDGSFTYQPNLNFASTDSFTYVANNGTHNSNEATVTLTVNPINDTPTALDDSYTILEDSVLAIAAPGVLDNDSDVDGDSLLAVLDTSTNDGTLVLNTDGSFTYTPDANFVGPDSFTYHANDGLLDSNIVTVDITISSENDAPVAQDDQAETQQNVPIRIDVLENDSDTEDDSLNIILTVDPSQTKGTVELEDTKILFTPNLDFVGETSFSYVVSDGDKTSNSAQVTVTITAVDDPNDDSVIDQILEQIQSLFDKVLNLEDEVTQLKEDNSALALRVSELESIVANGIQTNDDDNDDNEKILVCHKGKKTISISENGLSGHLKHGDSVGECSDNNEYSSKKEIENQIKALKKDFKTQEKALKNDFKAQEKDLKKQLKELKKDKKHHDEDDDDEDDD